MSNENLPTLFQELKVPATIQQQLLDLGDEFSTLDLDEQKEFIKLQIEQAALTTDGVRVKLPRAKLLHSGACLIELPGDRTTKEFDAVILDQFTTKGFWENEDADGSPPDCQSIGGITPAPWVKDPVSETCATCAHNRFGTALKGKGKRCKDNRRLVLRLIGVEGGHLPCILQVPATVLKAIETYLSDCVNEGTPIGTMVTRFRAIDIVNQANGQVSTGLEFTTVKTLSPIEQLHQKRDFITPFKDDFRSGGFEAFDDDDKAPAETEEERKASEAMSQADNESVPL